MSQMGVGRYDTQLFRARIQKNSQPSIRWTGAEIPEEFRRVTVELDGLKARDALKAAGELPDGFEVKYGTHLRIS